MTKLDLELSSLPLNDRGNAHRLLRRYGQDVSFDRERGWTVTCPNARRWLHGDRAVFLLADSALNLIAVEIEAARVAGPVAIKRRFKQRKETRAEFRKRIIAMEIWAAKSRRRIGPMIDAAALLCMQEQGTREITIQRLKSRKSGEAPRPRSRRDA